MENSVAINRPASFYGDIESKYRRNSFSKKKFIPRRSLAGKGFMYGKLSQAISRGWANNCVYPVGEVSNVVLTTLRCRERYANQRRETRFSFDLPTTKIKLYRKIPILFHDPRRNIATHLNRISANCQYSWILQQHSIFAKIHTYLPTNIPEEQISLKLSTWHCEKLPQIVCFEVF